MAAGSCACTRAPAAQLGQQGAAGGLAHVVGVGLEGQAPHGDGLAAQLAAVVRHDALAQHAALGVVALLGGGQQQRLDAGLPRAVDQRLHVLGKAAAAVAGAGVEEVIADARVAADAAAHRLDVGAQALGQAGDLVHEADLGGQHGVGGVLGQLGASHVHHHDAVVVAVEGRVQLAQLGLGGAAGGADDDAVGRWQSATAAPSFRNSGLETTSKASSAPRPASAARTVSATRSAVPTGTVDLLTMSLGSSMWPMLRATASTCCRSALPSSSGGVPTARNSSSPCATPAPRRW
jgi:hypothetical protein